MPAICTRCARQFPEDAPALTRSPIPGPFGKELAARICADCWRDWQGMEVMVINELRLNFMDPKSQEILDQEMRRYFLLDPANPSETTEPS